MEWFTAAGESSASLLKTFFDSLFNLMGATETKPAKEGQLIDDPKFEDYVRKTCQDASFNGMINKQSYYRIMSKLENFKIIRLAGTPLGERLFNILDDNVNG